MRKTSHSLVPTAWAATSPSAHVTRDAFEHIAGMIVETSGLPGRSTPFIWTCTVRW